ncbi:membrane hypothetical protein [Rhizobium mesoamericanum STM3625]|uniref:Uncharacterized protein n=1 Tax=Rhizobium mesoamericanum STM3625 TaxID=1211777 RepID=K0PMQ7_9HYPH|nr:membrane hypothetical protein [Rhizobium mesoamericanum STM3625]
MIAAGITFSILNVVTQWLTLMLAFPSASAAFWQYAFALIFSLPFLRRVGIGAMRTRYAWRHIARVALATFGVTTWVAGLASVPIWQAIALVMTTPFFMIMGAAVSSDRHRFLGAMICSRGRIVSVGPRSCRSFRPFCGAPHR